MIIRDIYTVEEAKALLPAFAEDTMDVSVGTYGYLHDVGTEIRLQRAMDPDAPKGWSTFTEDFEEAFRRCFSTWDLAAKAAYHGGF